MATQPAPGTAGGDWFHLELLEWMWRDDGLALRPGAELMVYATIYRASAHGGGAFVATNASMGVVLGYPRETVCRTVGKLLRAGLVCVVGHIHDAHGGRAVRCYAVCQPAIDRALSRMSARHLSGYLSPAVAPARFGVASPPTVPHDVSEGAEASRAHGEDTPEDVNVTRRHVGPDTFAGSFPQNVTGRHIARKERDDTSRDQRDDASRVTMRHIAQNGVPPADSPLFDMPLINTYYLSTNQGKTGAVENPSDGTCAARPDDALGNATDGMGSQDLDAFRTLLDRSARPVDAPYVAKNLSAFKALLAEGVTADVILEAYGAYADYQRRMLAEHGEMRPMHLLKWLRQRPNSNIQYVLNARDERWRREGARGSRQGQTTTKRPGHTHDDPRLMMCRDQGRPVWFVTDERGDRIVAGSLGVSSRTQALALYERMYESETSVR